MTHDREIAFGPGAEFRAVRRMIRRLGNVAAGIGDDVALVHVPRNNAVAVSTDTSVENVHFRRAWLAPDEIGYRAATAALSDLAAAGAAGVGIVVALTVPDNDRELLDGLTDGIARAAREAGVLVYGGDTTRGAQLSVTCTVLGVARESMPRECARAGDRLYVTGTLGGPAAAVRAWNAGEEPRAEWRARFASPCARIREARWLMGRGARAAIDISDGLVADAGHIAAASAVRVELQLDRLPRVAGVTPIEAAGSGEEYELLVASPIPIDTEAFEARFGIPLTQVGVVKDGNPSVRTSLHGRPVAVATGGYDHFAAS